MCEWMCVGVNVYVCVRVRASACLSVCVCVSKRRIESFESNSLFAQHSHGHPNAARNLSLEM